MQKRQSEWDEECACIGFWKRMHFHSELVFILEDGKCWSGGDQSLELRGLESMSGGRRGDQWPLGRKEEETENLSGWTLSSASWVKSGRS